MLTVRGYRPEIQQPGGPYQVESACNAGDTGNLGLIPGLGRSPV